MYGNFSEEPEPTITQSVEWYQSVAEQDDSDAQYTLGMILLREKDDNKRYPFALHWIEKSAKNGNTNAKNIIGL